MDENRRSNELRNCGSKELDTRCDPDQHGQYQLEEMEWENQRERSILFLLGSKD